MLRGSYEIMNGRHLAERLGAGEYSMDVPVCDANGHCETASQIIDLEKSVWGGGTHHPPPDAHRVAKSGMGKIPLLTEYALGYLSTLLITILVVAFFLPMPSPESCDSTQGGGRAASHDTPSSWLQ